MDQFEWRYSVPSSSADLLPAPIFISHSSRDSKVALTLCGALENRGARCWISSRDVGPGENFQEAIVRAIRGARLMILVFSNNANNSNEIKKEVALASQQKMVVIPVRVEDVAPSDAFTYELAIRQWIDLFDDWERALERLMSQIRTLQSLEGGEASSGVGTDVLRPLPVQPARRWVGIFATVAISLGVVVGAGFLSRDRIAAWLSAGRQEARIDPKTSEVKPADVKPVEVKPADVKAVDGGGSGASGGGDSVSRQSASIDGANPPGGSSPPQPPVVDAPVSEPIRTTAAPKVEQSMRATPVAAVGPPPSAQSIGDGGQTFRECEGCPEMVVIPAGATMIGSPPNEAARQATEMAPRMVKIAAPFAVGRFATTFAEWDACVAEGGCNNRRPGDYDWGRGRLPVIFVSWNDAKAYAAWLSAKTGQPYRLLTETEWEYVARGCRTTDCVKAPFWFGSEIKPELANYNTRYSYDGSPKAQPRQRTAPADEGVPNPFGVYHIIGNVRQWVEDCWSAAPSSQPEGGAARLTGDCRSRVTRGGAWSDEPKELRAGARSWAEAGERSLPQIGFRVARTLTP